MTSEVLYTGQLRTECTHNASGSTIITDAPVDNHGRGEAFSPTDLMATSLATCMLTVMGIKAVTMGLSLEGLRAGVQKEMAADPRRVSVIGIEVHIPESLQNLDPKSICILKHTADTCPVAKSLHPDVKVSVDWGAWNGA